MWMQHPVDGQAHCLRIPSPSRYWRAAGTAGLRTPILWFLAGSAASGLLLVLLWVLLRVILRVLLRSIIIR